MSEHLMRRSLPIVIFEIPAKSVCQKYMQNFAHLYVSTGTYKNTIVSEMLISHSLGNSAWDIMRYNRSNPEQ